jgi:hypothetical protein
MSTTPKSQGSHFWFMSLMASNVRDFSFHGRCGCWTPPEGMSRYDAFNELFRRVVEESPELRSATVVSFDIQPNTIEASR